MPLQQITAFLGPTSRQGNQRRQIAVAFPVLGQKHQFQAVDHRHFTADQQFQTKLLGRQMRPYDTGQRALIGQGQGGIPLRQGLLNQFVRVRRAAQETEIGEAMQLSVVRQHEVQPKSTPQRRKGAKEPQRKTLAKPWRLRAFALDASSSRKQAVQEPAFGTAKDPGPLALGIAGDKVITPDIAGCRQLALVPPTTFQALRP